jgi:hypothetical protein
MTLSVNSKNNLNCFGQISFNLIPDANKSLILFNLVCRWLHIGIFLYFKGKLSYNFIWNDNSPIIKISR